MVDPEALKSHVTALDAEGFQVHIHAIGDRAVREALDAFEAARVANGAGDQRHHIAHIQVIHPDDIGRFAELGVTANMQPLWATHEEQMDELTLPFLAADRAGWQYPFASLAARRDQVGGRQRLAGQQPEPALGNPRRGQPAAAGGRG